VRKMETRGHHSGNHVVGSGDRHARRVEQAPDDVRVGAVALAPQSIADDDYRVARIERAVLRESRTQLRRHAEQLKDVAAALDRVGALRLFAGTIEAHLGPPPRGGIAEGGLRRAIVHEVDRGQALLRQRLLGVGLPDRDQLLRLAIRKGLQQDGVDDAEDRRCGAGAEAERRDGDRRERRRASQLPPGEPDVAAHISKGRYLCHPLTARAPEWLALGWGMAERHSSDDIDQLIAELHASAAGGSPIASSATGDTTRLERWLRILADAGGSDLLLVAGAPPSIRVDGRVRPLA